MSEGQPFPEDLVNLERSLRTLAPRPTTLDRDSLMFAAGQESKANPPRVLWPVLAVISAFVGASLGFATGRGTITGSLEVAKEPPINATEATTDIVAPADVLIAVLTPTENSCFSLRQRALRDGVDALVVAAQDAEISEPRILRTEFRGRGLERLMTPDRS